MVTVATESSLSGLLSNLYIDNFHVGLAIVRGDGYVVFGQRGTHTKEEAARRLLELIIANKKQDLLKLENLRKSI